MENKLNEKITSLNDLRALSAMLVVMSHINCTSEFLGTRRGAYAVSIFYMLSSFLCMYTTNTDINFKEKLVYVSRKIIKLIPLYYIFTLFTFLIVLIKPSLFNTTTASAEHLVKSLLFIPYQNENGIVRPILDVTWFLVLFSGFILYLVYQELYLIKIEVLSALGYWVYSLLLDPSFLIRTHCSYNINLVLFP